MGRCMSRTPKFRKPPVVETVIGVQFPELAEFTSAHFGLYWNVIKRGYHKAEDRPRLPEVGEVFPRRPTVPTPGFRISNRAVPDRVWFTSESGSELLQVQPDRFLFNWREQPGEKYPSYTVNVRKFLRELSHFCQFCQNQGLGEPKPNVCEVAYINHIVPRDGESATELFANVFPGLKWEFSEEWDLPLESVQYNRVFVIGDQLGRLYAEASVASHPQMAEPFVFFRVTGRVNHPSDGNGELSDSLRVAHDSVVNGFAAMTDPTIQKDRWGRTM